MLSLPLWPRISHFFLESWFSSEGMELENQDLLAVAVCVFIMYTAISIHLCLRIHLKTMISHLKHWISDAMKVHFVLPMVQNFQQ